LQEKVKKLSGFTAEFLYDSLDQLKLCRLLLINMFKKIAMNNSTLGGMDHTTAGTLQMITERLANVLEKELNEDFIKRENWANTIKSLTKAAKNFVDNILETN